MPRMQIRLRDDQVRALALRAAGSSRSMPSLIREAVAAWLAADDRRLARQGALAAIGRFHSGLGDLAENHDRYFG